MSRKYFSSDFHLGHRMIVRQDARNFSSIEYMDHYIIRNIMDNMERGSDFYFLGDLAWTPEGAEFFFREAKKKNISVHWIVGNHDRRVKQYFSVATTIAAMREVKLTDGENTYPATLCHYPMLTYNKSHYNAFLLFGHHHAHTHGKEEIDRFEKNGKRLNVNCEFHDYLPVSEEQVIEIMKSRPDNWDLITKEDS
jgi:calcineurin-like phosphoesterase family protein